MAYHTDIPKTVIILPIIILLAGAAAFLMPTGSALLVMLVAFTIFAVLAINSSSSRY